jgi:hypothetical protein
MLIQMGDQGTQGCGRCDGWKGCEGRPGMRQLSQGAN